MKMKRYPVINLLIRAFAAAFAGMAIIASTINFGGHSEAAKAETVVPPAVTVVASGLNNPRGLNFGPDGALYVAEAGTGGAGPCGAGPEGERCYGESGSVTRIDPQTWTASRISSGLPSLATPDGSFATGIHDISFQGLGNIFLTIGFAGDPADRTLLFGPAGTNFARMARLDPRGNFRLYQDLGGYEASVNPTGDEADSNPYGILAIAGKTVYADAGGNSLNEVAAKGSIRTLATFPNRPGAMPSGFEFIPDLPPPGTLVEMDAVPTSVAIGPDGNYYVGQLTGFPFPVDDANVYRVPADGGTAEVFAGGFTSVIDVAFGPDGSMYVLELARNGLFAGFILGDWTGALIRIASNGTRTEIAPGTLTAPGGVAVGPDGALYVTNNSIFSGTGQVVRIEP